MLVRKLCAVLSCCGKRKTEDASSVKPESGVIDMELREVQDTKEDDKQDTSQFKATQIETKDYDPLDLVVVDKKLIRKDEEAFFTFVSYWLNK
jgi:hypothetical protein